MTSMNPQVNSSLDSGKRTGARRVRWTLAAAAVAVIALGTSQAQAGNEFADGFEDQLGRIVAAETFRAGSFLLFGPLALHARHHAAPRHDPGYHPRPHPRHERRAPHPGYHPRPHPRHGRPAPHPGFHQRHHTRPQPVHVVHHFHHGSQQPCMMRHGGGGHGFPAEGRRPHHARNHR